MASSFSVSLPIIINTCTSSNYSYLNPLFVISSCKKPIRRGQLIIICTSSTSSSAVSGDGLSSKDKKLLLERYGFDSKELLSQSSSKTRRRKGDEKKGRGTSVVPLEERKPPRTTHKLLQVLAGTARRKKLLSPKGMDVRPMMEVVKGAAFDILQVAGGNPASLRPGRWLDLYSGTGSVGIEAISRGCSEAHFVEMDPWVISEVLRPNLEWTEFLDASIIHTLRVETFLERADKFVGQNGSFDYISVTPPYTAVDYSVLMGQISSSALVDEDSFIVVEYPSRTDMLDTCGCLVKISDRRFGRTHLAIYGPKWAQKRRKSDNSAGTILRKFQVESKRNSFTET